MQFAYETVSKAWGTKFLDSNSDLITLATKPQHSYGTRFVVKEFSLHNRSGSAAVLGIGGRMQSSAWTFSVWDDSEYAAASVLIDDTADAQNSTTGDVNLDTVGTANDGFAIGCDVPFNMVALMISQASTAGTAWAAYYSKVSSGTGFSNNYTQITKFYVAPDVSSTGEQLIWFDAPADWHRVLPATAIVNRHGRSNLQVLGYTAPPQYRLVVKSTTAPNATRGLLTLANLGHVVMSTVNILDGDILTNIGGADIYLPPVCDAICAATSVADEQNRVDIKWRYSGQRRTYGTREHETRGRIFGVGGHAAREARDHASDHNAALRHRLVDHRDSAGGIRSA